MGKTPIEIILDAVEWKPVVYDEGYTHGGLPFATYTGVLNVGGYELECMVLNTGERLFTAESLERFFGKDIIAIRRAALKSAGEGK